MPKHRDQQGNFKGVDQGAAPNALEPGYFSNLENTDIYLKNVLRSRQGYKKVVELVDIQNCLSSGDMTDDFTSEPASGTSPSGAWGDFIHPTVSGIATNHTASGKFVQLVKGAGPSGDSAVFGIPSGEYVVGHHFDNLYPTWAVGYDYTESAFGPFCEGFAHYSQAGWASGAKPGGLQIAPMLGLAVRIQPETESYYFGYILPSVISDGEIVTWAIRLIKSVSGAVEFTSQGGSLASSVVSGVIRLEAHDDSDTSVTLKFMVDEVEEHTFTDNNAALYGDVLTSGYVGIGGINGLVGHGEQDKPSITYLAPNWEGGTLLDQEDGVLEPLPSGGYVAAMSPLRFRGNVGHFIVDASGNQFFLEQPEVLD